MPEVVGRIELIAFGKEWKLEIIKSTYISNDGMAVDLIDLETHEPFTRISVNLDATDQIPRDTFYVKHWSENEGIVGQLIAGGVIEEAKDVPPQTAGFIQNVKAYRLRGKEVIE